MYGLEAYKLAMENTKYVCDGRAAISKDDEWVNETEWDDLFNQLNKYKA